MKLPSLWSRQLSEKDKLIDLSPDRKVSIRLGLLVAILAAILAIGTKATSYAIQDSVWKAKMELRVERMEVEQENLKEIYQSFPGVVPSR